MVEGFRIYNSESLEFCGPVSLEPARDVGCMSAVLCGGLQHIYCWVAWLAFAG